MEVKQISYLLEYLCGDFQVITELAVKYLLPWVAWNLFNKEGKKREFSTHQKVNTDWALIKDILQLER